MAYLCTSWYIFVLTNTPCALYNSGMNKGSPNHVLEVVEMPHRGLQSETAIIPSRWEMSSKIFLSSFES